MPRTLSGIGDLESNIEKKIGWLVPAIEGWVRINRKFSGTYKTDAMYWYNERPSISTLAGGAFRAGLYVMEEYVTEKIKRRRRAKGRKRVNGRIDLFIAGKRADHEAVIEAKMCWVRPGTHKETLARSMKEACGNALDTDEYGYRLGAVFYVVRLKKDNVSETELRRQVERVRNIKPHVIAWCFPEKCRSLQARKGGKYVWPGVILAMKIAHGSQKLS
jgi:hypothetical protein